MNESKGEIPSITNLDTTSALTAVKNKMPSVSNLVKKKTEYNTIITEIGKKITDHNQDKYITTEFNKLTAEIFDLRLKRENWPSKTDIVNFVKNKDFDNKLKDVTSNKNELNEL